MVVCAVSIFLSAMLQKMEIHLREGRRFADSPFPTPQSTVNSGILII